MAKKQPAPKHDRFVLDCSLAVAWLFEDAANPYAEAVESSLTEVSALVPALWPLEVANALLVGERRQRVTEAKVKAFLGLLSALPIITDEETVTRAWQETIHLARAHRLSVYDAAYLELALRVGVPLATLDEKLKAAAHEVGVPSFQP